MQPADEVRFHHMLDSAQAAQRFLVGRTQADLGQDEMLLFAVVKALEIVGEAASRISPDARAALPNVPWPDIVGMRHRLIHAYYDINQIVVWRTVQEDLPPLVSQLMELLSESA